MNDDPLKRKSIRFTPDENTLALIELKPNSGDFEPKNIGLVVDESRYGSGIVMLRKHAPAIGQEIRVQIGRLPILKAVCAWIRDLDDHVVRVGLELED